MNSNGIEHTEASGDVERQVAALVERVVGATPYFVVDVEVKGREGSRAVNVFVDGDEGVGVDALADLSRRLEELLDEQDLVRGAYRLTVSSPGADRPLVQPRQYRKHIGRALRVALRGTGAGEPEQVDGVLRGADEEGLELEVGSGKRREQLRLPFARIAHATVQLPW